MEGLVILICNCYHNWLALLCSRDCVYVFSDLFYNGCSVCVHFTRWRATASPPRLCIQMHFEFFLSVKYGCPCHSLHAIRGRRSAWVWRLTEVWFASVFFSVVWSRMGFHWQLSSLYIADPGVNPNGLEHTPLDEQTLAETRHISDASRLMHEIIKFWHDTDLVSSKDQPLQRYC